MTDFTYPGSYTELLPAAQKPRTPLAQAAMAICGFTKKGPVNNPVDGYCTSWDEFVQKFGGLISTSRVPQSVKSYFEEGGSQVYVSRVLGSGSAAASMSITETVADELATVTFNGGSTAPSGARGLVSASDHSATPSRVMTCNLSRDPQYQSAAITLKYWAIGPVVAFEGTQVGDGATTAYTFTPGVAGYNANATYLEPGSVRVQVNAATTYYDKGDGTLITGAGATGTVHYATGAVSITFDAAPTLSHTIKVSYRRTAARVEKTIEISTSDVFSGDYDSGGTNSISRTTGAIVFTAASATYLVDGVAQANYTAVTDGYNWDGGGNNRAVTKVEVDYVEQFWTATAKNAGLDSNNLKVSLFGDPDSFTSATQSYSSFVLQVLEQDSNGIYIPVETFRKLNVTDSGAARWLPNIVNDPVLGSTRITMVAPFGGGAPVALGGVLTTQTLVADGLGAVQDVTATLSALPGRGSIQITFTDSSGDTAHVITDNALGTLVGSDPSAETTLDSTVTPTVNYDTGAIRFKTAVAVKTGTALTASFYAVPASSAVTVTMTGGLDGAALTRAEVSAAALSATSAGIYAFNSLNVALDLVQPPDFCSSKDVALDCVIYAESRTNVFAILATPEGYSNVLAREYRNISMASDSAKAAIYWPWVYVKDDVSGRTITFPPVAHVAGMIARCDSNRNPGKNPAGKEDGFLRTILGLETRVTDEVRGTLDPYGVNCISSSENIKHCVFGANTLRRDRSANDRFVNATRGNIYLLSRFYASGWKYPFENNNADLRLKIGRELTDYMKTLWQAGWFKGARASDAFYVVCDASNNPDVVVNAYRIVADIGVAWNKPALFVSSRLQQTTI